MTEKQLDDMESWYPESAHPDLHRLIAEVRRLRTACSAMLDVQRECFCISPDHKCAVCLAEAALAEQV